MKKTIAEKIRETLKNMAIEDYVLLFVILTFVLFNLLIILGFKQLPSPLYGGDYYHSMGALNHFKYGGNPFLSESLIGSLPHYFPLYTILVGGIAMLFSLQTFLAMKLFAIVEVVFAVIIVFLLGKKVFKDKWPALIFVLLYLAFIGRFPVWKYLQFSITLIWPLLILSFFYFYEKRNMKSAVFAGVMLGIMGVSHSVGFVSSLFFIGMIILYLLFFQFFKKRKNESQQKTKLFFDKESFFKNFFKLLKISMLVLIIGFVIAQLYWFKPLFVHHGNTLNSLQDYAQNDLTSAKNVWYFVKTRVLNSYFLDFSSIYSGLKSLLFLTGIAAFIFLRKQTTESRFLGIVLITAFIATFHFFITQPLFNTVLSPLYITHFVFLSSCTLFACFAIKVFANSFKKYKLFIFIGFFVVLFAFNFTQSFSYQKNDRWINVGRTELSPHISIMGDWVTKNTGVNDVFLTTNELGFALNAVSGRKLVTMRRGHVDLFTDMDKRMLDAAILLYGNDTDKRKELFKEYDVKYLYWDSYWLQSDYRFGEKGNLIGTFDPLLLFKSDEHLKMLNKYNISFFEQHTWLDPTIKGFWVKKADFIFILPTQFNITHPWHPDLDNYLEEAWNFERGGVVFSRIYKIVNAD